MPDSTTSATSRITSAVDLIDAEIAELEGQANQIQERLIQLRNARECLAGGLSATDASPSDGRKERSAAETIRSFARQAIGEAGHPLSRGEILRLMRSSGVELNISEPQKTIARTLSDSRDFERIEGKFRLAGQPGPEGSDVQTKQTRKAAKTKKAKTVRSAAAKGQRAGLSGRIRDLARAELKEVSQPLTGRQIHQRLKEKGVDLGVTDPVGRISSTLSMSDDFVSTGRGYWFADSAEPLEVPQSSPVIQEPQEMQSNEA